MIKNQIINPQIAAHNIASIFCKRLVKKLKDAPMLSADKTEAGDIVDEVSELYGIVYDRSYLYFSRQNKDIMFDEDDL